MSFAIIDQGRRVNTPLRSIFPERGVDKMSQSDTAHTSTDNNKDSATRNSEFRDLLERQTNHSEEQTPGTYDGLKPSASQAQKKQGLVASQIMSHPVHSIVEGTTIHGAWERMQSLDVSHLIVTNSSDQTLGIISKSDLAILGPDSTQSITPHYNKRMIAGLPSTSVAKIAACFLEFDINAIPIFDQEDSLVGIVSRSDLLRLIISGAHVESWA